MNKVDYQLPVGASNANGRLHHSRWSQYMATADCINDRNDNTPTVI